MEAKVNLEEFLISLYNQAAINGWVQSAFLNAWERQNIEYDKSIGKLVEMQPTPPKMPLFAIGDIISFEGESFVVDAISHDNEEYILRNCNDGRSMNMDFIHEDKCKLIKQYFEPKDYGLYTYVVEDLSLDGFTIGQTYQFIKGSLNGMNCILTNADYIRKHFRPANKEEIVKWMHSSF